MKAKHLRAAARCRCGAVFTRQDKLGAWYWCLYCDAHITGCKAKGSPAACICQLIGTP